MTKELEENIVSLSLKLKEQCEENVRLRNMIQKLKYSNVRDVVEFEARLQFIRIFDYICNQHKCHWYIIGEFVRMLFSNHHLHNTKLEIWLSAFNIRDTHALHNTFNTGILSKLEMMGIIDNIQVTGSTYECDIVQVMTKDNNSSTSIVTFPVVFYCNESVKPQFGCELLNVSPYGMSLTRRDITLDRLNVNHGVGLLNHILDIKKMKARPINTYVNIPTSYILRIENADLLKRHAKMLQEGYRVEELRGIIQTAQVETECPICMDSNKHSTKLKCGHCFCLECLSLHLEKLGEQHGRCPLCRGDILFDI